jgi:hypothetical protein
MVLVFHYYRGKIGLNIFPDLKSKQIKYLKKNKPTFLFWTKQSLFILFKAFIS